jgi:hypothetical protein
MRKEKIKNIQIKVFGKPQLSEEQETKTIIMNKLKKVLLHEARMLENI